MTHHDIRYNKHAKSLVRDMSHPEAHLANSASQDVAARYVNLKESGYKVSTDSCHFCVLSVPKRHDHPTETELADLRYLGLAVDPFDIKFYAVAHIMGVHFRAGEWGQRPRCGSVVTCVMGGQSLYARVNRFLKIRSEDGPGYASVTWFSKPEYPTGTPIVVKVGEDDGGLDALHGCVISIDLIDPSRVMVECLTQPVGEYFVMRDSGFDPIKP